jgi:hypothetical protein
MMFRMVRRNPESKTFVRFILFLKYVVWACVFTAASFTYEEKWQAATVFLLWGILAAIVVYGEERDRPETRDE